MKNDRNQFQQLVDRDLSGLTWTRQHSQRVLNALKPEGKIVVRRKYSVALAAMAVLLLMSAIALASGLVFSSEYHARRSAEQALQDQYGITQEMLSFFSKNVWKDEEQNALAVEYEGIDDFRCVLGTYTVWVTKDGARASWSHDGKSTEGGFDAEAWGAEQIQKIIENVKETNGLGEAHEKAKEIQARAGEETNQTFGEKPNQAYWEKYNQAQSLAKVSLSEARTLAQDVLTAEYPLIGEQAENLDWIDTNYTMQGDIPAIYVSYWFWQAESEDFTEGNGIYTVAIHAQTGEILSVDYDSALAGNG